VKVKSRQSVEGTLTTAADSQASYDLVDRLRSTVHAIPGADAKVGGGSAVNLDIQRATRHDTNGMITSAGIVLAGTFAALGTLPLVFITEIGFAVAFGVLLDTFVVRSVLVTALNLDVGRWIWWPSSLHANTTSTSTSSTPKPPRSPAEHHAHRHRSRPVDGRQVLDGATSGPHG
jgi:hypothetical protein